MKTTKQEDGVRVFREALVAFDAEGRRFRFMPTGDGRKAGLYDRCSAMKCPVGTSDSELADVTGHTKPEPDCTCGFYAHRGATKRPTSTTGPAFLMRAELSGRLLEYEEGWRAEHLDVVELFAPTYCSGTVDGGGSGCGAHSRFFMLAHAAWGAPIAGASIVWPVCHDHVGEHAIVIGREELERSLRVPIIETLPHQYLTDAQAAPATVVVDRGGDDALRAIPGDGVLAELFRKFPTDPRWPDATDVRKLLQTPWRQQVRLQTADPIRQLLLDIEQAEGRLECRFVVDGGNYTRSFTIPL